MKPITPKCFSLNITGFFFLSDSYCDSELAIKSIHAYFKLWSHSFTLQLLWLFSFSKPFQLGHSYTRTPTSLFLGRLSARTQGTEQSPGAGWSRCNREVGKSGDGVQCDENSQALEIGGGEGGHWLSVGLHLFHYKVCSWCIIAVSALLRGL